MTHRAWCFTYYPNDPDVFVSPVNVSDATYLKRAIWQWELCPSTKRIHLQGFVRWERPCGLVQCSTWLGLRGAHLEPARGSDQDNYEYCSKLESRLKVTEEPIVLGNWKTDKRKGKFDEYSNLLVEAGQKAVYDKDPGFCLQYARKIKEFDEQFVTRYIDGCHEKKRDVKVIFMSTPTGYGKTTSVYKAFGMGVYRVRLHKPGEEPWMDGYAGEKVILMDEVKRYDYTTTMMNEWCDGFPTRLRTKNNHCWANWELIIITSNYGFHECFDDPHKALARRITDHVIRTGPAIMYEPWILMNVLDKPAYKNFMDYVNLDYRTEYEEDTKAFPLH